MTEEKREPRHLASPRRSGWTDSALGTIEPAAPEPEATEPDSPEPEGPEPTEPEQTAQETTWQDEIVVVAGSPSDAEIAATTAVVSGAIEELVAADEPEPFVHRSAWQLSQRGLRSQITPGPGRWRGFAG